MLSSFFSICSSILNFILLLVIIFPFLKEDSSEYVRKSVGNALRDISKKFPELIKAELNSWKLESKEINQLLGVLFHILFSCKIHQMRSEE
ncbi:Heat repeat protein, partial [human gut metagenome]